MSGSRRQPYVECAVRTSSEKGTLFCGLSPYCRGTRVYNEASNTGSSTHKNAVTCKK